MDDFIGYEFQEASGGAYPGESIYIYATLVLIDSNEFLYNQVENS